MVKHILSLSVPVTKLPKRNSVPVFVPIRSASTQDQVLVFLHLYKLKGKTWYLILLKFVLFRLHVYSFKGWLPENRSTNEIRTESP